MDNIQGVFFSKENISNLNKNLLNKLNIKNLSQEIRKDIVETIVDNMKQVWSKIDKTKVNNSNINNILLQFNNYSCEQTHTILKNKYMPIFNSYRESIIIKDHVKAKHIIAGDHSYYLGHHMSCEDSTV